MWPHNDELSVDPTFEGLKTRFFLDCWSIGVDWMIYIGWVKEKFEVKTVKVQFNFKHSDNKHLLKK